METSTVSFSGVSLRIRRPSLWRLVMATSHPYRLSRSSIPKVEPKVPEPTPLSRIFKKAARSSTSGVVVQGIDDVLVRFAKCCNPLPGDPILGFVTRGRGITVHLASCSRAIDMDPDRRMEVEVGRPSEHRASGDCQDYDRGSAGSVGGDFPSLYRQQGQYLPGELPCVIGEDRAVNTFEVMIRDKDQLRRVFGKIRGAGRRERGSGLNRF